MKFLCLPGSYSSAQHFQAILGPLQRELCEDGNHTFHYMQGSVVCELPPHAKAYFGPPPHYSFLSYGDEFSVLHDYYEFDSAEDTMRTLSMKRGDTRKAVRNAMAHIEAAIQSHGPFDAVIGYSEGAMLAASLLVEDQRQQQEQAMAPRFKFGVFICGWPPISTLTDETLLADECGQLIEVPTCHVVGACDPFVAGSVALYNLCKTDEVRLFDTGRGHIVPRDKRTVVELASTLNELVSSCA